MTFKENISPHKIRFSLIGDGITFSITKGFPERVSKSRTSCIKSGWFFLFSTGVEDQNLWHGGLAQIKSNSFKNPTSNERTSWFIMVNG